jgi:hypothetical protein
MVMPTGAGSGGQNDLENKHRRDRKEKQEDKSRYMKDRLQDGSSHD